MAGYVYKGTIFDAKQKPGRAPRPTDPALCGTLKGVWQHRRDKTKVCPECCEAYNVTRRKGRPA